MIELRNHFALQNIATYEQMVATYKIEPKFPFLNKQLANTLFHLPDHLKINGNKMGVLLYELLNSNITRKDIYGVCQFKYDAINSYLINQAEVVAKILLDDKDIVAIFTDSFIKKSFLCKKPRDIQAAWMILMYSLWHQSHIRKIKPIPDTINFLTAR